MVKIGLAQNQKKIFNIAVHPKIYDADFIHRKYLSKKIKNIYEKIPPNKTILDVGCGWMQYKAFLKVKCKDYIGVDIIKLPGVEIKLIKNNKFPIDSNSIDICLSWQVLEHVKNIDLFFNEIKRCLKKEGTIFLSTHGFFRIHSNEDYWRWTENGLIELFKLNGFNNIEVYRIDNSISAIVSIFNSLFIELNTSKKKTVRRIIKLINILIFSLTNSIGYCISKLCDKIDVKDCKKNPSTYLIKAQLKDKIYK